MAEDRFWIVSPCCVTEGGSSDIAVCTRLFTLTVLMSGLLPSSNDTVRL